MAYNRRWTTSASSGLTMAKLSLRVPSCVTMGGCGHKYQAHPISVKPLRLLLPLTDMSKRLTSLRKRREESLPSKESGRTEPRGKHSDRWKRTTVPLPPSPPLRLTETLQFSLDDSQPIVVGQIQVILSLFTCQGRIALQQLILRGLSHGDWTFLL